MNENTLLSPVRNALLPVTAPDSVFGVMRRLYDQFLFFLYSLSLRVQKRFQRILQDDSGIGTIELVLILVVLIALVLIFKEHIQKLLTNIFDQINSSATKVY